MQSIILIGDETLTIDKIIELKHICSTKKYALDTGRYVIEFKDGHIYYDFNENLNSEYDEDELKKLPFNNPNLIMMTYSSKELMKRILTQENFLNGIYIDDDYGRIIPIEEFIKDINEGS